MHIEFVLNILNLDILQGTVISVQELHPLMLGHAHQQGVQLSPTLDILYKKNALQLEPEWPINIC